MIDILCYWKIEYPNQYPHFVEDATWVQFDGIAPDPEEGTWVYEDELAKAQPHVDAGHFANWIDFLRQITAEDTLYQRITVHTRDKVDLTNVGVLFMQALESELTHENPTRLQPFWTDFLTVLATDPTWVSPSVPEATEWNTRIIDLMMPKFLLLT
jgi:hypothetical protein